MLGRKMNAQCVFSVHIRPKAIIDENPHNSSTQLKTSKCIKQYYQKILFRAGTLRELDTKRGTTTKMHLEVSEQKERADTSHQSDSLCRLHFSPSSSPKDLGDIGSKSCLEFMAFAPCSHILPTLLSNYWGPPGSYLFQTNLD